MQCRVERETRDYLEAQARAEEASTTCEACGELKAFDEFPGYCGICYECEQDGQYLAGGEFFEDAGGHVIGVSLLAEQIRRIGMVTEEMRIAKAIECLKDGEILAAKELINTVLEERNKVVFGSYEEVQEAAFHDQLP